MFQWIIPLLIATLFGFLAGIGVGGGSLLLLWLTQVVGMPQPQARILNLLFFLPAAISATLFHKKETALDWKVILPGILTGCAAAAICSTIGKSLDTDIMKKILGGLLVFTGLREIFYRPRNAK